MIGIVVVSHSAQLAEAAVRLTEEMLTGERPRIAVAAGLADGAVGTDAVRVSEAIAEVDGPDGVVVLLDLGSAILSAEFALDLLDPETKDRVLLSPAPFLEGLLAAAVTAAGGGTREQVAAEAAGALLGKQEQLGAQSGTGGGAAGDGGASGTTSGGGAAGDGGASGTTGDGGASGYSGAAGDGGADGAGPPAVTAEFTVTPPHGLHARPAALLVTAVRGHDATVTLTNRTTGRGPVPAGSLSRIATLGALHGHRVEVAATGPEAATAVDAVLALAADGFGEAEGSDQGPAQTTGQRAARPATQTDADTPPAGGPGQAQPAAGHPVGASPGIGIGPVRHLAASAWVVPEDQPGDPAAQWARLEVARTQAMADVAASRAAVRDPADAAIFDAHLLLLDDEDMLAAARGLIEAGAGAAAAWSMTVQAVSEELAAVDDPYLRERAADVRDVGTAVLHRLAGTSPAVITEPGVLVTTDLAPAQVAALDPVVAQAVVLAAGSPTAHAAILARGKGIPMVVGAGAAVLGAAEGTTVAVDGSSGEVVLDPGPAELAAWRARKDAGLADREAALAAAHGEARTLDGVTVPVLANIGSAAEAREAAALGADGTGLVRTEFLFHDRPTAPDRAEQEAELRAIATAFDGRRVVVRTLDAGGDKPLPYAPMPAEANPFLGTRGLRFSLREGRLLAEQLSAICAVAQTRRLAVMFPMVTTPEELHAAREALAAAAGAVGGGRQPMIDVGIMVEVPAAALKAAAFAPHVDFFSIGTNDLAQYTLAAERGNAAMASLADALDPGVLALIEATCSGAGGVPVSVCGELAADPLAVPVLLGLGVTSLSVSQTAVAQVKQAVRLLSVADCRDLAREALGCADAAEVRALVAGTLRQSEGSGPAGGVARAADAP